MATKFVQATSKKLNYASKFHDTDSPLELFQEVQALNVKNGQTMKDWDFTLHNYKGDKLGKYDWKNAWVNVTLGDLFS
jgi:hypothetical protein